MKNRIMVLVISLTIILFMNGCSSKTIQTVPTPNLSKPLDNNKSIVEINEGELSSIAVSSNGKEIGTVGQDKNLIWETNANSMECLSHTRDSTIAVLQNSLTPDELPYAYKCYLTKPGKVTKLEFHIPDRWAATTTSFPLRKVANYNELTKDKFKIDSINIVDNSKISTNNDIVRFLKEKLSTQLKNNIVSTNETKSIDLFIEEYQEGNSVGRWLYPTLKGSTILKIKMNIKENNQIIDTYITRLSIIQGGLWTTNGHEYIFDDAAKDIATYLLYN